MPPHRVLVLLLLGALTAACAPQTVTTGAFTQVGRISGELQRGVSTKADVERVLGPANGTGRMLPPTDPRPREVWSYINVEVKRGQSEGRGVIRMESSQQILLVFFDKEVFDGFMWWSDTGEALGTASGL